MKRQIRTFAADERGNAVIDWSVLMAGLIMMAFAVVAAITDQTDRITDDTLEMLDAVKVN
jgi:Flp pilus assembly pilin Flp